VGYRSCSGIYRSTPGFVLFTAEVSITYMDVGAADALINWAAKLPKGTYIIFHHL
jgi:tRNA wybutosine-synthesizing protein 4